MSAFVNNSEEAWDVLLEATGAASYDDARANAPAINVQHSQTGRGSQKRSAGQHALRPAMHLGLVACHVACSSALTAC